MLNKKIYEFAKKTVKITSGSTILIRQKYALIYNFDVKYTERKKKRRVNFIPKFHSSLKKFVKYFTLITKRYMYGTKVPNFIGL